MTAHLISKMDRNAREIFVVLVALCESRPFLAYAIPGVLFNFFWKEHFSQLCDECSLSKPWIRVSSITVHIGESICFYFT